MGGRPQHKDYSTLSIHAWPKVRASLMPHRVPRPGSRDFQGNNGRPSLPKVRYLNGYNLLLKHRPCRTQSSLTHQRTSRPEAPPGLWQAGR